MGRLTKEEQEYIKEHPQLKNIELAEILHHDRHSIGKYKKTLGIAFTQVHNFLKYNEYIKENYNKRTAKSLAEEIGCSKEYVAKVWAEAGLKGKPNVSYYCDYNFFENINTANKAYILGFLASDGNLYKRDGHAGQIQLTLHQKDKEILDRILQVMQSNHPIKIGTTKPTACITIVSEKMYNDLLKIGLTPNKTLNLKISEIFNNIPQKYWTDFFRGYFDGDGCVHVQEKPSAGYASIALPEYSSSVFLEKLKILTGLNFTFQPDNRTEKYTLPFGSITTKNATEKYIFLKLFFYFPFFKACVS